LHAIKVMSYLARYKGHVLPCML